MNLSMGLAAAVMLVGLVMMAINKRWNEIAYICFAMGLLAFLLKFAGSASLHVGSNDCGPAQQLPVIFSQR